jgi:PIN domain nuclease of toxin-antitoxin system
MSTEPEGVLLDTCAVIWLMAGVLSPPVVGRITAAGMAGGIYVSPVSAWEIGMLSRAKPGRTSVPQFLPDPATWFATLMSRPGIKQAPLTPAIAIDASFLPGELHSDPADRFLVATGRTMGLPIVTGDRKIIAYAAAGHVDVIAC